MSRLDMMTEYQTLYIGSGYKWREGGAMYEYEHRYDSKTYAGLRNYMLLFREGKINRETMVKVIRAWQNAGASTK